MPGRKEVARIAGVSTATVTRVTSGKGYVSAEVRERVQKVIRELEYQPNQLARNLRMKRSNVIAVLIQDISNPYYIDQIDAMVEEARKYNCIISLFLINEYVEKNKINELIDEICANQVIGMVNITGIVFEEKYLEKFRQMKLRGVYLDNTNHILINYESSMREAYRILKEKGKKRVAFFGGHPMQYILRDDRYRAFQTLNREFGMDTEPEIVVDGDYPNTPYFKIGYEATQKLMREKVFFDGVFCITDSMVPGVIKGLVEYGKRVPNDIGLFACDNTWLSSILLPSVTTIDASGREVGKSYIRYILNLEDESLKKFPTRLIRRESL